MKRILLSALIGVGMVALLFPRFSGSEAARTPEDYPLVCRGGGSLVTGIAPGEGNIGFTFVRGTKPAGEGLAPGECSWKDRGMYPNEPDRVSQHVEEGSDSLKEGGTLAPENRWYEELHSSDKYWTFMVSNNGRGQLIASSARPNKEMNVSPTARVPSAIGQIIRPDLPKARTPDDETPRVIVLNSPAEMSSRTERIGGLSIERNMNIPPVPDGLRLEEKVGLLRSTGLKTLDEAPAPYVTLTPKQSHVAGRGDLTFFLPEVLNQNQNKAIWRISDSPDAGSLFVVLNFETAGLYLMTFTVKAATFTIVPTPVGGPEMFVLSPEPERAEQEFIVKKTDEWQHLNAIVDVGKPGSYNFRLDARGENKTRYWILGSCEVSAWRK